MDCFRKIAIISTLLMLLVVFPKPVSSEEIPRLTGKPSDILFIAGICGDNYNSTHDAALFFKYAATDNLRLSSKFALNEKYPLSLGWDMFLRNYGFLNYYLSQEIYFDKYYKAIYSAKFGYEIHPKTVRGHENPGSIPVSFHLELGFMLNPLRPKLQIGFGIYMPSDYSHD